MMTYLYILDGLLPLQFLTSFGSYLINGFLWCYIEIEN